ncbi:helix-turn-helix domain-containing protein [Streptomyces sp. NPDC001054]
MTRDWTRLAKAVEARRKTLGLSQVQLADKAGVSESTVQNLEAGHRRTRMPTSLPGVERALGWAPESAASILTGGEPTPLPEPAPEAPKLPLRIQQELADGQLIDATVLDLAPGSGAKMIVVVKGEPDASPEEIRTSLLAWARAQEALKDVTSD